MRKQISGNKSRADADTAGVDAATFSADDPSLVLQASSSAEATRDKPPNGQEVDPVAEQEEDTSQMVGQIKEEVAELCGQVEELQAKVDRCAERVYSLENNYCILNNRFTSFKDIVIVGSFIAVMLAIMIVGTAFIVHQLRYDHQLARDHNLQQTEESMVDKGQTQVDSAAGWLDEE